MEHATWRERSRLLRLARLWRTRCPVTFTEKVRYKMVRDHRRLLVTFADKVAVRDYVAAAIGPEYLPEAYGIVSDPSRLRSVTRPAAYVVKPSHGSGAVIVVSPDAPADAVLPPPEHSWIYRHVRPRAVDDDHLEQIGRHWLSQLYGQGPNREWAYGLVPRRILVEELLTGPDGSIPDDYKLFVFHEQCHFVQVDTGRFGPRTQDFYRPDWSHLELSGGLPWAAVPQPRPERLDEMITLAERLARGTDFVRVDLYVLAGAGRADRIVFGELTSYPAGGNSPFEPERFNAEFGRPWTVPRRYR